MAQLDPPSLRLWFLTQTIFEPQIDANEREWDQLFVCIRVPSWFLFIRIRGCLAVRISF